MLKKEQFEALKEYRVQLYNTLYLDFIRLSSIKDKEILAKLYKEIFNKDSEIITGCNRCLLRDTKKLAQVYFDYEKKIEEETKNDNTEQSTTTRSKKGRRSKSN